MERIYSFNFIFVGPRLWTGRWCVCQWHWFLNSYPIKNAPPWISQKERSYYPALLGLFRVARGNKKTWFGKATPIPLSAPTIPKRSKYLDDSHERFVLYKVSSLLNYFPERFTFSFVLSRFSLIFRVLSVSLRPPSDSFYFRTVSISSLYPIPDGPSRLFPFWLFDGHWFFYITFADWCDGSLLPTFLWKVDGSAVRSKATSSFKTSHERAEKVLYKWESITNGGLVFSYNRKKMVCTGKSPH